MNGCGLTKELNKDLYMPGIGNWIKFTPQKIGSIMKNYSIEKPNPKTSEHIYTF